MGGKNVGGFCVCCIVVVVVFGGVDNDVDGLGWGVFVVKEGLYILLEIVF